jgi:hypothetical protein
MLSLSKRDVKHGGGLQADDLLLVDMPAADRSKIWT